MTTDSDEQTTISQLIIDRIKQLNIGSIVILKGFNHYLRDIADQLIFTSDILNNDRINTESVQQIIGRYDGTKLMPYEDYLVLQDRQLSGLLAPFPDVVI